MNAPSDTKPRIAERWNRKAIEHYRQGEFEQAAGAYREVLALYPATAEIWGNLGLALHDLRRFDEAHAAIDTALRLRPNYPEALNTLGGIYLGVKAHAKAADAYRRAIACAPGYVNAWINLGNALWETGDDAGAVAAYEEVLRLAPGHPAALAELTHLLRRLCRWDSAAAAQAALLKTLPDAQGINPFIATLYAPPRLQLDNAQHWAARHYPLGMAYSASRTLPCDARSDQRLRVGYLSSDFHAHATAFLISELFEQHDRSRFEIYVYSCGGEDAMARIRGSVDHFRDLRTAGTRAAYAQIENDGIDILIDLKGYTQHHRMDIMSARPAPIQVHYLGYPGTTGAKFIDYFIADAITTPPEMDSMFSECLIRLPHSYQINDHKRPLPEDKTSRAEHGLPEKSFVFCAFNSTYKITPEMYDVWMRLLDALEGSVLWLFESNAEAAENIKRESKKRGVDPARILFAAYAPLSEHLARYQHVDLFLDTFPVCGHTTASDVLWCGVPVVIFAGDSFASRVAASLLHAVNLPELVTTDLAAYESLALALARNPDRLSGLKRHLAQSRMQFPLFNSLATTRSLESAYEQMAHRHRNQQKPSGFKVD